MKKVDKHLRNIFGSLVISAILALLYPIFEMIWNIVKQLINEHQVVWNGILEDYLVGYVATTVIIFISLLYEVYKKGK